MLQNYTLKASKSILSKDAATAATVVNNPMQSAVSSVGYIPPGAVGGPDEAHRQQRQQEDKVASQNYSGLNKPIMMFDKRINAVYRYGVPFACVCNFALFLWSNTDVGATVNIEMDIVDAVLGPVGIFHFGLGDTVQEMWDAKVYLLAILIAFFSGFWPYLKITCMFLAWVLPVGNFPEDKRQLVLTVMDILGKWSLIDVFVLTLMMVAFFFKLSVGTEILVLVTVYPELGFYTFLIGTISSLVIGHITLHLHRVAIKPIRIHSAHSNVSDEWKCEEVVNVAAMNHLYSISSALGEVTLTLKPSNP